MKKYGLRRIRQEKSSEAFGDGTCDVEVKLIKHELSDQPPVLPSLLINMAVPVNFFQRPNAAVFPTGFLATAVAAAAVAAAAGGAVEGVAAALAISPLEGDTTPPLPPMDFAVATTGVVMVVLVVVAK